MNTLKQIALYTIIALFPFCAIAKGPPGLKESKDMQHKGVNQAAAAGTQNNSPYDRIPTAIAENANDDAYSVFKRMMGTNSFAVSLLNTYKEQYEEYNQLANERNNTDNLSAAQRTQNESRYWKVKNNLEYTEKRLENIGFDLERPPSDTEMAEINKLRINIVNGNDNILDVEGKKIIGSYFRASTNVPKDQVYDRFDRTKRDIIDRIINR